MLIIDPTIIDLSRSGENQVRKTSDVFMRKTFSFFSGQTSNYQVKVVPKGTAKKHGRSQYLRQHVRRWQVSDISRPPVELADFIRGRSNLSNRADTISRVKYERPFLRHRHRELGRFRAACYRDANLTETDFSRDFMHHRCIDSVRKWMPLLNPTNEQPRGRSKSFSGGTE